MKKHTLKERLEEFVEYLDLTNQKFEQNAGLPNGFINKSGKYISDKSEQKIINTYPDLNMTWLLTGEGEMLKSNDITTPHNNIEQDKNAIEKIEQDVIFLKEEIIYLREQNKKLLDLLTKE